MKTDREPRKFVGEGVRIAVVASRWHAEYMSGLIEGTVAAAKEARVLASELFRVPGAFEVPLACLRAAETERFDAVVALAVVIRGDTPHFEYVAGEASRGIMEVSLRTGVPVLNGLVTVDTPEQAAARCGELKNNKGYEAAMSAFEMVAELADIRNVGSHKASSSDVV